MELLLQNNPKQGNINIRVLSLPTEQKFSGIFGLYNLDAYSITELNHSSGELKIDDQTFQVLKRSHQRHRDCWSTRKVDQERLKKTLMML